jgi:hypothetical protein
VIYSLLRLYEDELDLIWEKVGLKQREFRILDEYLRIGCQMGAASKCNLSRQRVHQVVSTTYRKLTKPQALRELRSARELFNRDMSDLDRYIECSVAMHGFE